MNEWSLTIVSAITAVVLAGGLLLLRSPTRRSWLLAGATVVVGAIGLLHERPFLRISYGVLATALLVLAAISYSRRSRAPSHDPEAGLGQN